MAAAGKRAASGANAGGGRGAQAPAGRRELLLCNALAVLLILASAFAVIRTTHICRTLYAQLQDLEAAQWYLQEDYSRLLLEQSTWASHYRVEQVARGDLHMRAPDLTQLKVLPR
ncbi:MAG: cell division protein FtsL [Halioglobus sp.]|nr:cell division protein FtsL [Halioglobus sp.]